jgi:hypothetical protein
MDFSRVMQGRKWKPHEAFYLSDSSYVTLRGSHGGDYEEFHLLGHNAAYPLKVNRHCEAMYCLEK